MVSLRLREIASFVPDNSSIINIGTDHALLEIYLKTTRNIKCIGTDINEHSVNKAKENISKLNLDIDIICTNGLNNIKLNNEIIILSGLGTKTILEILNKKINNDLIIQSNNNHDFLKKSLKKRKYYIYKEKTIYDKRWYTIIYFKKKKNFIRGRSYIYANNDYLKYLLSIKEKELSKIPNREFIKKLKKKIALKKLRLSMKT